MTVVSIVNSIIDAINALPVSAIFAYGQVIGGILSAILVVGIVIVVRKIEVLEKPEHALIEGMKKAAEGHGVDIIHKQKSAAVWKDIVGKIHSSNASDWLLAVIQADALVDDIVKRMGLPGETMGERLQNLDASKLRSLQDVWDAHKIRNRVAHTPATMLRHDELSDAIEKYKKALKELQYID